MKKVEIVAFYLVIAVTVLIAIIVSKIVAQSQNHSESIVGRELQTIENRDELRSITVSD